MRLLLDLIFYKYDKRKHVKTVHSNNLVQVLFDANFTKGLISQGWELKVDLLVLDGFGCPFFRPILVLDVNTQQKMDFKRR